MKRFVSVLLVAILVVTCMSTVAFAATQVKTGDVKTFTVTVSGPEFQGYTVKLYAAPGLEIQSIKGATGNVATGLVSWSSASPVSSHSFEVTVKVTATEVGVYNVSSSVQKAYKFVDPSLDTEDGIADGLIDVTSSTKSSGASFEIVCEHKWGDWSVVTPADCHNEGLEKRVCSVCGAEETRKIAKLEHVWGTAWEKNDQGHWHVCTLCGDPAAAENHFWAWIIDRKPDFETQTNGLKHKHCHICGHNWDYSDIDWREDPEGGDKVFDLTATIYGAAAVMSMVASAAYVTKRKSV